MRLADQEGSATAHDTGALAQDQLDHARIGLVAGDLPRALGRHHGGEHDGPPLDLRDRLLRHAHHVAVAQAARRALARGQQQAGQVVARL